MTRRPVDSLVATPRRGSVRCHAPEHVPQAVPCSRIRVPTDDFNRGGRPVENDDDRDGDDVDETTDQRATHEPAGVTVDDNEAEVSDDDLGRVETWGKTVDEPGTPMSELLHDGEPT